MVDDVYGSVSEDMIFKVSYQYLISNPLVMEIYKVEANSNVHVHVFCILS